MSIDIPLQLIPFRGYFVHSEYLLFSLKSALYMAFKFPFLCIGALLGRFENNISVSNQQLKRKTCLLYKTHVAPSLVYCRFPALLKILRTWPVCFRGYETDSEILSFCISLRQAHTAWWLDSQSLWWWKCHSSLGGLKPGATETKPSTQGNIT